MSDGSDRRVTVGWTRKVNPGQYQAEEISVFLSEVVEPGVDFESAASGLVRKLFFLAKAEGLEQLGLGYTVDEKGVVRETETAVQTVAQGLGPVAVQAPQAQAPAPAPQALPNPMGGPQYAPVVPFPAAPAPAPGIVPGQNVNQTVGDPSAPYPGQCSQCGGTEFWDNRAENAQNRVQGYSLGSDWKCKNQACGKAYWPSDFNDYKGRPKRPR